MRGDLPCSWQEYGSRRPLKIGYYVEQESYLAVAPPCQRAVLMVKEHLEKQGHEVGSNSNFCPQFLELLLGDLHLLVYSVMVLICTCEMSFCKGTHRTRCDANLKSFFFAN